jgi:PAS domain S-box-containing protein
MMHSRYDQHGIYLSASEEAKALLGFEPDELVGTSAYAYFHPEDLAIIAASHARVLGLSDTTTATYRIRHRDGHYLTVTSTSVTHRETASGEIEIDSVTMPARLQQGEIRRTLEQEFAYLVERATSMVAVLDVDLARILYANPLLESTVGVEFGTLEGASFFELVHPSTLPRAVGALSVLLHNPEGMTTLRCCLRHVSGAAMPVSMIVLDLSADPAVEGLLIVAHDASTTEPTARSPLSEPLDDVVDRSLLHQHLVALMEDPATVQAGLALATIRLDDFDNVGAALGGAAAAEVLTQATSRISNLPSINGTITHVAQLGAGRLAVLVHGLSELELARTFGERVRDVLGLAFHIDDSEVFVSPRIAVAITQEGATADGLLAASHSVLEQSGKGSRVSAFRTTRQDVASTRLQLRADLHHAIERDELTLHYQPTFSLDDHTMSGAEALVRWQHPTRGLLAPGEFLELAEESDFIVPLGSWVLHAACQQLAIWQRTLPDGPSCVSVNVSAHQLLDARFPEAVSDALTMTGLPADQLCLEITETAVLDPDGRVNVVLDQLIGTGVKIAIDDFGTGHANLSYLKRIPAHVIKIDRSFVIGLNDDNPTDAAIVAGTVAMAHTLGRSVTAEGVETPKQLSALRSFGCDHVQGYLLSPPVPADRLSAIALTAKL